MVQEIRFANREIIASMNKDKMTAVEFQALLRGDTVQGHGIIPTVNRKVQNATKTERDGVVFDSRLERHMHDVLTLHGIGFLFQKQYTVQEGFKYNGESIRPITYTVDFYLPDYDIAIDTKGVTTQQSQLRIKMLKRLFADLGRTTTIEIPQTPAECDALVARIISDR